MQSLIFRPEYCYTLNVSNTAAASSRAVPMGTNVIRLVSTVDCWINLDATAAQGSGFFLPAAHVEYFHVDSSDVVNVISNTTATGTLSVSEASL